MSVSKDGTQRISGNKTANIRAPKVNASPSLRSKREGTRVGTLADYRGAGKGAGVAGRRNQLRDGS